MKSCIFVLPETTDKETERERDMSWYELDTEAAYRLRSRTMVSMRRVLLVEAGAVQAPASQPLDPERTRPGNDLPYETRHNSFDNQIVIITGALLVLLLGLLLMHFLLRCIFRHLRLTLPPQTSALPHPMKKRQIRSLPSFRCQSDSDNVAPSNCAICLADFSEGDLIRVLPTCQHGFHAGCVDTWLERQATCPTCRADLLKEEAKSTAMEVEVVITPTGELCPTLSGDPKEHHHSPTFTST